MRRTKQQKINQEAEMYRLGQEAANNAVGITNWPRVGKKYSPEWYRCKHAWQHGYKCFLMADEQAVNPILPVENYPPYRPDATERDQLAALMVNIIIQFAPISLRALCRKFSSRERLTIIGIVTEWYDKDILNVEYKGKRTSPTKILGFSEIPVIESYLSARPGNSPASPPQETTKLTSDGYEIIGDIMHESYTSEELAEMSKNIEPSGLAPETTGLPADFPDYTDSDALADNLRDADRPIETEETE